MADISKITLPNGSTYDIKDAWAREQISAITGGDAVVFKGVSSTPLTDGGNENPTVDGTEKTAKETGDLYFYQQEEFIYGDDNKWHSLGSPLTVLGDLAYKDTASGDFTPAGTITDGTFTGTQGNITATGTPTGSISIGTGSGTANYTPAGTVSQPTTTVTLTNTTVNSITDVGTLASCTLPTLATSVENENLTIDWTVGSYTAGTLPTKGADVSVATGVDSAVTTQPTFTGTGVELTGSFTGDSMSATGTFTPEGTISGTSFTGTQGTVTVS